MADVVRATLQYDANFGPAIAQSRALATEVGKLNAQFNAFDAQAAKIRNSVAETFRANIGSVNGFTSKMVDMQTETELFGKRLQQNKLTMREYFSEAFKGLTRQDSLMRRFARDQLRLQQSILVPTGAGPGGQQRGLAFIPDAAVISDSTQKMQLLSNEFNTFRHLVKAGTTELVNFGKNTQWTGRQLTVGLTMPIVLFGATFAKTFMDIDKELTRFAKVYGGDLTANTTRATEIMRDQVVSLGKVISSQLGVSLKETAALAADIAATGQEGQDLINMVSQTTRLAVLGEVDRQEAMKATLAIQSAFKTNTEDLAESINFLNAVENQTSTTLNDLVEAIPKAGPVVKGLGGSIKDLSVLLVAMREGGIPASEAANAIKSGLASLINPTQKASEVAKQFGVDLEAIVDANQGKFMPTIMAMRDALNNLDQFARSKIIEEIFGKYQFARMSALFNNIGRAGSQSQQALELANASVEQLASTANQEMTRLTESATVKFARAMETVKNTLLPIGATLLEMVTPALQTVSKLFESVGDMISKLPEPLKNFMKTMGGLALLAGPALMLVGLFTNLIGNAGKLGMAITSLGAKLFGIKVGDLEFLSDETIAATKGVETLSNSFKNQTEALKFLNNEMQQYMASLQQIAANPANVGANPAAPPPYGPVPQRMQTGGKLGGYGGGDKVPALLEPGEFVVRKEMAAKYGPVLEQINNDKGERRRNGGFAGGGILRLEGGGEIFLGGIKAYKEVEKAKAIRSGLIAANEQASSGQFASMPVTQLGPKVKSIGGMSSFFPGINGIYEINGQQFVIKGHDTAESAFAEARGAQLTRDIFGLRTPNQQVIKIKHPTTGDILFAVSSPFDPTFAQTTERVTSESFYDQALAAIIRRDKDLQADNLYDNIVTDVGAAFVANKASQPRIIGAELPSVADQAAINFLMTKGGARKWFAENTAYIAQSTTPEQYEAGFKQAIAKASSRAEAAIMQLPMLTDQERNMYMRIVTDLKEAEAINWRSIHEFHKSIVPDVKRPPTAAAIAKKEAEELQRQRERGAMASWEYGMPFTFNVGGMVPRMNKARVPGYEGGGTVRGIDKTMQYIQSLLNPSTGTMTQEQVQAFLESEQSYLAGENTQGFFASRGAAAMGADVLQRIKKLNLSSADELALQKALEEHTGFGAKDPSSAYGSPMMLAGLSPDIVMTGSKKLQDAIAQILGDETALIRLYRATAAQLDDRGVPIDPSISSFGMSTGPVEPAKPYYSMTSDPLLATKYSHSMRNRIVEVDVPISAIVGIAGVNYLTDNPQEKEFIIRGDKMPTNLRYINPYARGIGAGIGGTGQDTFLSMIAPVSAGGSSAAGKQFVLDVLGRAGITRGDIRPEELQAVRQIVSGMAAERGLTIPSTAREREKMLSELLGLGYGQSATISNLARILGPDKLSAYMVNPSAPGFMLGPVKRYSTGGKLPGYGGGDIVPALLTPGEFVINKEATAKYEPILQAMNKGAIRGYEGGDKVTAGPRILPTIPSQYRLDKERGLYKPDTSIAEFSPTRVATRGPRAGKIGSGLMADIMDDPIIGSAYQAYIKALQSVGTELEAKRQELAEQIVEQSGGFIDLERALKMVKTPIAQAQSIDRAHLGLQPEGEREQLGKTWSLKGLASDIGGPNRALPFMTRTTNQGEGERLTITEEQIKDRAQRAAEMATEEQLVFLGATREQLASEAERIYRTGEQPVTPLAQKAAANIFKVLYEDIMKIYANNAALEKPPTKSTVEEQMKAQGLADQPGYFLVAAETLDTLSARGLQPSTLDYEELTRSATVETQQEVSESLVTGLEKWTGRLETDLQGNVVGFSDVGIGGSSLRDFSRKTDMPPEQITENWRNFIQQPGSVSVISGSTPEFSPDVITQLGTVSSGRQELAKGILAQNEETQRAFAQSLAETSQITQQKIVEALDASLVKIKNDPSISDSAKIGAETGVNIVKGYLAGMKSGGFEAAKIQSPSKEGFDAGNEIGSNIVRAFIEGLQKSGMQMNAPQDVSRAMDIGLSQIEAKRQEIYQRQEEIPEMIQALESRKANVNYGQEGRSEDALALEAEALNQEILALKKQQQEDNQTLSKLTAIEAELTQKKVEIEQQTNKAAQENLTNEQKQASAMQPAAQRTRTPGPRTPVPIVEGSVEAEAQALAMNTAQQESAQDVVESNNNQANANNKAAEAANKTAQRVQNLNKVSSGLSSAMSKATMGMFAISSVMSSLSAFNPALGEATQGLNNFVFGISAAMGVFQFVTMAMQALAASAAKAAAAQAAGGSVGIIGKLSMLLMNPVVAAVAIAAVGATVALLWYTNKLRLEYEAMRKQAVAAFAEPTETAKFFGKQLLTLKDAMGAVEESSAALGRASRESVLVDPETAEAVKKDYADLIGKLEGMSAQGAATELALAFNMMVARGLSGKEAKVAIKAIAVEAGQLGGLELSEAFIKSIKKPEDIVASTNLILQSQMDLMLGIQEATAAAQTNLEDFAPSPEAYDIFYEFLQKAAEPVVSSGEPSTISLETTSSPYDWKDMALSLSSVFEPAVRDMRIAQDLLVKIKEMASAGENTTKQIAELNDILNDLTAYASGMTDPTSKRKLLEAIELTRQNASEVKEYATAVNDANQYLNQFTVFTTDFTKKLIEQNIQLLANAPSAAAEVSFGLDESFKIMDNARFARQQQLAEALQQSTVGLTEDEQNQLAELTDKKQRNIELTQEELNTLDNLVQRTIDRNKAEKEYNRLLEDTNEETDALYFALVETNPVVAKIATAYRDNYEVLKLLTKATVFGLLPSQKELNKYLIDEVTLREDILRLALQTEVTYKEGLQQIKDQEDALMDAIRDRVRPERDAAQKELNRLKKEKQGLLDDIDKRRRQADKSFDKDMEQSDARLKALDLEKDRVNKLTENYIDSLERRAGADEYYANQAKTGLGGLRALASGDVFGFLEAREQMGTDAVQKAQDEAMKNIEDRRDAELELIQAKIDAEQEYKNQRQIDHETYLRNLDIEARAVRKAYVQPMREARTTLQETNAILNADLPQAVKRFGDRYEKDSVGPIEKSYELIQKMLYTTLIVSGVGTEDAFRQVFGDEEYNRQAQFVRNPIYQTQSKFLTPSGDALPTYSAEGGVSGLPGTSAVTVAGQTIVAFSNVYGGMFPMSYGAGQVGATATMANDTADIVAYGQNYAITSTGYVLVDPKWDRKSPLPWSGGQSLGGLPNQAETVALVNQGVQTIKDNNGNIYKWNTTNQSWVLVPKKSDGGFISKYPGGGKVRGPGGPTEDKIPAMLSNGEYVIRASSVDKYGTQFLDRVNQGELPGFNGGGYAFDYAGFANAAGAGGGSGPLPRTLTNNPITGKPYGGGPIVGKYVQQTSTDPMKNLSNMFNIAYSAFDQARIATAAATENMFGMGTGIYTAANMSANQDGTISSKVNPETLTGTRTAATISGRTPKEYTDISDFEKNIAIGATLLNLLPTPGIGFAARAAVLHGIKMSTTKGVGAVIRGIAKTSQRMKPKGKYVAKGAKFADEQLAGRVFDYGYDSLAEQGRTRFAQGGLADSGILEPGFLTGLSLESSKPIVDFSGNTRGLDEPNATNIIPNPTSPDYTSGSAYYANPGYAAPFVAPNTDGQLAINYAAAQIGDPYTKTGYPDPPNTWGCSVLTAWAYGAGVPNGWKKYPWPTYSTSQMQASRLLVTRAAGYPGDGQEPPIPEIGLMPGDLIYFTNTGLPPSSKHIGLYYGPGKMIHSGDPVAVQDLQSSWNRRYFDSAARPIPRFAKGGLVGGIQKFADGGVVRQVNWARENILGTRYGTGHLYYNGILPAEAYSDKYRPKSIGCSPLVHLLYSRAGKKYLHPYLAREQESQGGRRLMAGEYETGDAVFFGGSDGEPTSHVALLSRQTGRNFWNIIHASNSAGRVLEEGLAGFIQRIKRKDPNFGISSVKRLQDGGSIYGPGGPTDDLIPAMLSNGEYVVRASSVDKYGVGFMDMLNAGKFAKGGIATDAEMPKFSMPSMRVPDAKTVVSTNSNNIVVNVNGAKDPNRIAAEVIDIIERNVSRFKNNSRVVV